MQIVSTIKKDFCPKGIFRGKQLLCPAYTLLCSGLFINSFLEKVKFQLFLHCLLKQRKKELA